MTQLVLLRHGESVSNRDGHFTGWHDVELSPKGELEAERAGLLLKGTGFRFDMCFTSELKRATDTLRIVLEAMDLNEATVRRSWRLNERHYGALEGIDPLRAIRKFGIRPILDSQLRFNSAPPPLDPCDARFPGNQLRYSCIDRNQLPLAEEYGASSPACIALLERNHCAGNCPWQAGSCRRTQAYLASLDNATGRLVSHPAHKAVNSQWAATGIRT